MSRLQYYLLLDHVLIQDANAISSPLTYGFPAITGFLGAIHALSRKLEVDPDEEVYLDGVLIACHQCDVKAYRPNGYSDYRFNLTRNSIGKDGKTRSIIEEGKVDLDVSLIVEVVCTEDALYGEDVQKGFVEQVLTKLTQQRIAGGSVFGVGEVKLIEKSVTTSTEELISDLLPAFVLIDGKDDLQQLTNELQTKDPDATSLDVLIETAKLNAIPQDNGLWQTTSIKTGHGWLVPIPLGYQAISPLFLAGKVAHTRDNHHASQFVEAVYGLGKWVFPFDIEDNFEQAFWRYQTATKQSNDAELYLISQELNK
ncbi:type I-F CRISPR-associated protein Csy2 [Orbaceae bacterium ac157xtp]